MNWTVQDCSPFLRKVSVADAEWLRQLSVAAKQGSTVFRLEEGRDDEPVVYCERDGRWWAGRYIGSLMFQGRRLDIRPRFGEKTLRAWLCGAQNVALVDSPGSVVKDDLLVPWLLASLWSRALVNAARHGLPSETMGVNETGMLVKGRLDIVGTVRRRVSGVSGVASVRLSRSLDNAIVAAIVAGYAALNDSLSGQKVTEWVPDRVAELMPHLIAAVGARPKIPSNSDIQGTRLTPITRGFRPAAELSARIARQRGFIGDAANPGECRGLLFDVAELWELYVISVLQRAWPTWEVAHGTRESSEYRSLLSNLSGRRLGELKPDALIRRGGRVVGVVDAKYKRLTVTAWNTAPQREDLYQLSAYVTRYRQFNTPVRAMLAYPVDSVEGTTPQVERENPWYLDRDTPIYFLTLPHDLEEAVIKIRTLWPTHPV